MQPEIQARADKLIQSYSDVEGRIQVVTAQYVASRSPMRREQMRALQLMQAISDETLHQRSAQGAGLLRMAYVRGGRSVESTFRLDEEDESALEVLTGAFLYGMHTAERAVIIQAQTAFRFVGLGSQARRMAEAGAIHFGVMADFFAAKAVGNPGRPLEQYARATVTFASERAFSNGEISATERYS